MSPKSLDLLIILIGVLADIVLQLIRGSVAGVLNIDPAMLFVYNTSPLLLIMAGVGDLISKIKGRF